MAGPHVVLKYKVRIIAFALHVILCFKTTGHIFAENFKQAKQLLNLIYFDITSPQY